MWHGSDYGVCAVWAIRRGTQDKAHYSTSRSCWRGPILSCLRQRVEEKMNARKRRPQEEAKEAEMSRKELGLDEGVRSLKATIQSRQKHRQKEMDNFLAPMEAKYCKPFKWGGKKNGSQERKEIMEYSLQKSIGVNWYLCRQGTVKIWRQKSAHLLRKVVFQA